MIVSAPGKIILFGEHAVVYGKGAIAAAIDKRVYVRIKNSSKTEVFARDLGVKGIFYDFDRDKFFPDYNKASKIFSYVKVSMEKAFEESDKKKNFRIEIFSEIPVGSGLGSSAAVAVSLIKGISESLGVDIREERLAKLGHEVEKEVQGASSGIDPTVSSKGGIIYYKKGSFKKLKFQEIPLTIGFVGYSGSTKEMVEKVRNLREKYPEIVDSLFDVVDEISFRAKELIQKKMDLQEFGNLMNLNHGILTSIGVGTRELENLVSSCLLVSKGAKITGAGGGGCMFALGKCEDAIKIAGGIPIMARISKKGVKIEKRK